jgi:hypothetical protein
MPGGYQGKGLTQAEVDVITADFRSRGGIVDQSPGVQRYLEKQGAGGATYTESLILLPAHPTRTAVFEELIHADQFRGGVSLQPRRRGVLQYEAEAAETLIRHRHTWRLPPDEIRQVIENLRSIRTELQEHGADR